MFRVGEKIVCNLKLRFDADSLTIGKIYTTLQVEEYLSDDSVLIKNDRGESILWWSNRFISLQEYRKQKIESLCLKKEI